jgi:excisionase family DNA binding protein
MWLARRLNVSRHRAYELMRERRVPGVVRIGRQLRIDPEAVEAWIQDGGSRTK